MMVLGDALSWSAIRRDEPDALKRAENEARALARALAVESLASDPEAELAELEERRRHLTAAAWPESPLGGFSLQSSLGAYVVARVAMAWVPPGQMGLRRRPQSPEALARALEQSGVEPATARSVIGDWPGAPDGFEGDLEGLDAGRLAGLAERALTAEERNEALAQVAVSPRDLARLGATLTLGRAVRRLLPVLPDDGLGTELSATLALVATDRADRVLELLPEEAGTLRERTVRELAEAIVRLGRGEPVELPSDVWAPPLGLTSAPTGAAAESIGPSVAHPGAQPGDDAQDVLAEGLEAATPEAGDERPAEAEVDPAASGADDVLEILEETVDPERPPLGRWQRSPELPRAWPGGPAPDASELAWARLRTHASIGSAHGGLLGLPVAPAEDRGGPVPPDPRLLGQDEGVTERIDLEGLQAAPRAEGTVAEPFLPAARSALRAVVAGAEGETLPDPSSAGAFEWLAARAQALAAAGRGDLAAAEAALAPLGEREAPERRWIRDRRVRYQGREAEPLPAGDARVAAAGLALDLARSLARTLAGGGPPPSRELDPWPTSSEG